MSKDAKLHKKFIQGEISAKDAIRQALAHGIAAGRASMKAEIVKAIEETPRQHHSELGYNGPIGWWTVKTSDLLTRIERTGV